MTDIEELLLLYLNEILPTEELLRLGDMNKDGNITPQDVQELYSTGKVDLSTITIGLPGLPPGAKPLEMVFIRAGTFTM